MITNVQIHQHTGDRSRQGARLWTEKIGFDILTDQPMGPDNRWIELGIAAAETRVVLFKTKGQEDRAGAAFAGSFACDDVEATYRQLTKRGVDFKSPPSKQSWGVFAIMKDPDDNEFVLSSRY